MGIELLKNKIITALYKSDDNGELSFKVHDNEYINFVAVGDCCSTTWFEHFSGIENLISNQIIDIEEVDMSHLNEDINEESGCYDEIQVYGIKIKTTKGYVDIEFRNSSNGYYGGWVETYKEDSLDESLKLVTEDF